MAKTEGTSEREGISVGGTCGPHHRRNILTNPQLHLMFVNEFSFMLSVVWSESWRISALLQRCSVCNCKLVSVNDPSVEGKVPEYVFHAQSEFSQSPQCGRIYWKGSHYWRIEQRLYWIRGNQDEQA